jgi:hypothetical protein
MAWVGFLAAGVLAGCEEHQQPAIQNAPEYLHEALAGGVDAQSALARCLGAQQGCVGYPQDAAMACAWHGVKLASQTPDLSLADDDAYRAACTGGDRTFHQRASLAQEDFTLRIYRRHAPVWSTAPEAGPERLYPSIETVRGRVNHALGRYHLPLLPRFGAPQQTGAAPGRITWSSCAAAVCLEGDAPAFGGGLFSYKISINASPTPDQKATLAAQLAGAGLETPGIAEGLVSASGPHRLAAGGFCWTSNDAKNGGAVAEVLAGSC